MSKVTLSGFIVVPSEDLDAVREALPEHVERTRAEEGCLVFSVEESVTEPGQFEVYEEFDSKEAFEHHQKRAAGSEWGAITGNVSRHYAIEGLEPPGD